jgi:hypothetical protein
MFEIGNRTPVSLLFYLESRPNEGVRMRTPAEYRAEAEMYVRQADGAGSEARRTRFLEMATACLRLADLAELVAGGAAAGGARMSAPLYTGL